MAYTVEGSYGGGGFYIADSNGAVEYDLIANRASAEAICEILNEGIGPEWDQVSQILEFAGIEVQFL